MTRIAISATPTGTGTFTLEAPVSNNNRTFTLPDASGTLIAGSLATQAEAQAGTSNTAVMTPLRTREAFNATGTAPVYACRAWVNFDGTTSPGTIRASGNVSSVTKNGTGDYTINFATAMPDANYSYQLSGRQNTSGNIIDAIMGHPTTSQATTTSFRVVVYTVAGSSSFSARDSAVLTAAVFR
jgi:hypothetical protein